MVLFFIVLLAALIKQNLEKGVALDAHLHLIALKGLLQGNSVVYKELELIRKTLDINRICLLVIAITKPGNVESQAKIISPVGPTASADNTATAI